MTASKIHAFVEHRRHSLVKQRLAMAGAGAKIMFDQDKHVIMLVLAELETFAKWLDNESPKQA